MESNSKFSDIKQPSLMNNELEQKNPLHNNNDQLPLIRPTILFAATPNEGVNARYYNIDNICLSPSPLDTRPRLFRAGSLINPSNYDEILSSIYTPGNTKPIEVNEKKNENNKELLDEEVFDRTDFNYQCEHEIQQLTQMVRTNRPINDIMANIIMQQLNEILEKITTNYDKNNTIQNDSETSSIIISTRRQYPPDNQTGFVDDHDRPYADYGHLNRQEIAKECEFNFQLPSPLSSPSISPPCSRSSSNQRKSIRLNAKSFAITSWTNVSKDCVMDEIKRKFGIENIQYICIGEEISELNHQKHLHIQIIFKEKLDRKKPFLDKITKSHCNYQVTQNDCAWNEYIKKGGNYIEFNEFKSTRTRGQKQWPSQSPSQASSRIHVRSRVTTTDYLPTTTTTSTTINNTTKKRTIRERSEEKQKQKEDIARHAFSLAKTNVNDALIFMRDNSAPTEFLRYSHWYKNTFNLIYLLEQYEMDRNNNNDKKYTWPESFPDCTPALREIVDNWLREEFNRSSRAKCLILIGGTGTGKSTFAKSLSGSYNYFQGRWRLDSWKDSARYLIFDDIPWDKFDQLGFPPKKALLTQNGLTMVTDKYKPSTEIHIRQPAIVLLNSDDAGSLITQPITNEQQQIAEYWKHRAIIYRLGSNEYFHKPDYYHDEDMNQISNNPSMNTI